MMTRRFALGAVLALVFAASCSNARVGNYDNPETPVGFEPVNDGGAEASLDAEIAYCAVTTCSRPWATCESSKFPCDVDLLTDDENCGECGARCSGADPDNFSKWSCVGGKCTFSCAVGRSNCDGDPSNGCEAYLPEDPENCGVCGLKCQNGDWCSEAMCQPRCVVLGQPDECGDQCTDLKRDDYNCGTCGVECDPTGPGLPALPADMYYGCSNGECAVPKCWFGGYQNCNGKLEDGCEASTETTENCGGCGIVCPAGKVCALDGSQMRCLCDDGLTYCNASLVGGCKQLNDDPVHCGGCNHVCPGLQTPHFEATCSSGICGGKCQSNYADCDGLAANGCEVDTQVDNRNCGGCGQACLQNQVCSGGKCLVAPCEPGTPETTK